MGTGTCIALIAIGAILRFAIAAGSPHGLNVHVVGVVLMLAGLLGLVLSLLVWGPLNPARRRRNSLGGYDGGPPPVVEERRVYRDQTPRVVEERRLYRDQTPL
jgi:hypothetical protein